jgi:hypothetical protein
MEEEMWSNAIINIAFVSAGLLFLFVFTLIFSLRTASNYLTPLVVISDYSKKKADQIANPSESNKEIDPIKLIDVNYNLFIL